MNALFQSLSGLLAPVFSGIFEPLRDAFLAREQRERWLLIAAALILVAGAWYNLVQKPLQQDIQRYSLRNQSDQETLSWMHTAAAQIKAQGGPSTQSSTQGSLLSLADSSLRRLGLGEALQRIQPDDLNNVKIWLDNANFDNLLRWFAQMENQGLVISVVGITAPAGESKTSGKVNARITLTRPS